MSKQERPLTAVEGYKKQAERLREYLGNGGIDLKQTNALEAVARMHGYPNFNTLRNSAQMREHKEMWCVLRFGRARLPDVSVSYDPELAYASFLQLVAMNVSLIPQGAYAIAAIEDDAALRGIYLFDGEVLVAALITPGGLAEDESNPVPRGLFNPEHPHRAAADLARAIEHRNDPGVEERQARFQYSVVALNLTRDLDEIIRSEYAVQPAIGDGNALWDLMQNVSVWGEMTAKVMPYG